MHQYTLHEAPSLPFVLPSFAELSLMMGNRLPVARMGWRVIPILEHLEVDEVAQILELSQVRFVVF